MAKETVKVKALLAFQDVDAKKGRTKSEEWMVTPERAKQLVERSNEYSRRNPKKGNFVTVLEMPKQEAEVKKTKAVKANTIESTTEDSKTKE